MDNERWEIPHETPFPFDELDKVIPVTSSKEYEVIELINSLLMF